MLSGGAAAFFADSMPLIAIGLTVLTVATFTIAAHHKTTRGRCGASGCGCSTAP